MSAIAIVSAGSYGTALARVLSDRGHHTRLHVRETDTYRLIANSKVNATYLPAIPLDTDLIHPTTDLADAIRGADFIFLTIPTQHARLTLRELGSFIEPNCILVLTCKGLEQSGATISEIAKKELPGAPLCGLYGITFARAIALGQRFTAMCLAGENLKNARAVAELFGKSSGGFRIHLSTDLRGAELGGAMKNAYAITMGILDEYLESTAPSAHPGEAMESRPRASRYSLMNLCMLEFVQFGLKSGLQPHTLLGPSGIGDLAACTSTLSRNYQYGRWMAETELKTVARRAPDVHEGFDTVKGAFALLLRTEGVEMPLLRTTNDILFHGRKIAEIIPELLRQLSVCVEPNECLDFVKKTPKPRVFPEKKGLTAFISYRYSPEGEIYYQVARDICKLHEFEASTGRPDAPQLPQVTVDDIVRKKINRADLYLAIFLNDGSDNTWLTKELTIAKGNKRKPMLVFVQKGLLTKQVQVVLGDHPYHLFSRDTFASDVEMFLKNAKDEIRGTKSTRR